MRISVTFFLPLSILIACGGSNNSVGIFNTPPSVSIVSPPDGTEANEGTVIEFEALVDDDLDEGDSLEVRWSSDLDGELTGDFGVVQGYSRYSTANLSAGNHTINILVVDSEGEGTSDAIGITIVDLPDAPEIALVHPTGGEHANEGEEFEFVVRVEDSFDAPETLDVEFKSDMDGVFCQPSPDTVGVASCEQVLSPGDHLLTFTVTDTEGFEASATWYFTVIAGTEIDDDGDGWTESQGDCNDEDATVSPAGTEYYNGRDDDCDGVIDNDTDGYDDDGDGQSEIDGDCDDTDANTYTGAPETCDDADNDCDSIIDETTICYDDDGDGWTEIAGDCDDTSVYVYPSAVESADGLDNDCDGTIDEGTTAYDDDGDCYCETGTCSGSVDGTCTSVTSGDCDDANDAISPAATESCGDGVDNDCDGSADEENASSCSYYYYDYDGDGYGSSSVAGKCLCSKSSYYTSAYNTDCYDYNTSANPAATSYSTSSRGDGSFDYNCDGSQSKYWTSSGGCGSWPGCSATTGWASSVASCGSSASYVTSCSLDWFNCAESTSTYIQKCL